MNHHRLNIQTITLFATTSYPFKGNDVYHVRMVKSFTTNEELVVVAERSEHDSDALQWHVLKHSRPFESQRLSRARLIQRISSLRQETSQANIESTTAKVNE